MIVPVAAISLRESPSSNRNSDGPLRPSFSPAPPALPTGRKPHNKKTLRTPAIRDLELPRRASTERASGRGFSGCSHGSMPWADDADRLSR